MPLLRCQVELDIVENGCNDGEGVFILHMVRDLVRPGMCQIHDLQRKIDKPGREGAGNLKVTKELDAVLLVSQLGD